MSKLIFKHGSMNASKSANLIMDWYGQKSDNKSVIAFKSTIDTRDYGYIASRAIQTKVPAILITPDAYGVMYETAKIFMPNTVFIDEGQFMNKKQVDELAMIVDDLNITVQVYGLMTTFKSELFEGSKRLVEIADVVERIRSECTRCSNEGLMNARFVDNCMQMDGETVVVGAELTYKVLCRKCYRGEIENGCY